ncbi:AAA family ATPase [Mycolicibacterium hodleri]|uniref:AAA family ATPase n=1 Tax=Mycolicibacterium hodleri TaxID=49897 RepID=UPI002352EBD5|nr:AAA family ATPase [Mycolicibacterium hodleri]
MTTPHETDSVPPWPKFTRPVLEVLSDGQIWQTAALKSAVMDLAQLSPEQRARTLTSGQGQANNRIGWALSFLTRAKAVEKVANGRSAITEFGRQLMQAHPDGITQADLEAIPAFQAYVPKKHAAARIADDTENLPSYWFVGAFFNDEDDDGGPDGDQTERFVAESRWENGVGNTGKYTDLVKAMKPGERIAIKAAFTRIHELPFENKGNRASVMAIKATGTVTHNHGDGHHVDVDWDQPEPVREWYFYTSRQTVWRVKPTDWTTKALVEFTFDSAEQDYEEFRNAGSWAKSFGDDAPEVIVDCDDETVEEETAATPCYGPSDIVDDGCFLSVATLTGYLDALERKKNLILQGPPGTGKTWLAKRLGRAIIGQGSADLLRSVQFHPSLSYEDFVRGWRPSGAGGLVLTDGLFLDIVQQAQSAPGDKHVLVIEEINRGNLAQIFGELLTLLEADKRDPSEALTLTYRKAAEVPIYLPPNLYLIGTMNLADRSLAIVDFALRRRFAFADLSPAFNDAWQVWVHRRNGLDVNLLAALANRIGALNERIAGDRSLGEQYRVGHSFFTPASDATIDDPQGWIRQVVEQEIRPLLAEYWFDDPARVAAETAALIGSA